MHLLLQSNGWLQTISQPWHWSVSGAAIALTLLVLTWMGKSFGVSRSFQVMCATSGIGKYLPYFNLSVKENVWQLVFALGAIIGGYLGATYLQSPEPVAISDATLSHLEQWDIAYPETIEDGSGMLPTDIFNLQSPKGILLAIIGGFLVGFGTRYAGGCTSGHAITGLSHLQWPSLIAVIGFFVGGLVMTYLIMPFIFAP